MNQSGGQAGYFAGGVTVTRDLDVRGAVIGFSAVLAVNVGTVTMHRGDAVAILGARHGPSGTYLLLVAPASKGQAVIGIVDQAVEVTTIPAPAAEQNALGVWVSGSYDATVTASVGNTVTPGSSLLVATNGLFSTANVSATAGPVVVGDLLVAGDTPGQLVPAGTSPVAGTVVGYALSGVASGTALIPVLIEPR